MKIFITGDTHGTIDLNKIFFKHWPQSRELTRGDILIILGDFGIIWENQPNRAEDFYLTRFNQLPFTLAFFNGNHDNIPRLNQFKEVDFYGGRANHITDNVYRLRNGEIFDFDGTKVFVMGGGLSIDKEIRTPGITWWPEEIPNYAEVHNGLSNLNKHGNKVDFVLTHAIHQDGFDEMCRKIDYFGPGKEKDPLLKILQEFKDITDFKHWFCGHYHLDQTFDDNDFTIVYNRILELLA